MKEAPPHYWPFPAGTPPVRREIAKGRISSGFMLGKIKLLTPSAHEKALGRACPKSGVHWMQARRTTDFIPGAEL